MPQTPDRRPGALIEDDEVRLTPNLSGPSTGGAFNYDGSDFVFRDALGSFNPRTGGSGITAAQHKALRQLVHLAHNGPFEGFASGAYLETLPSADPFPTSFTWYEDNTKTKKIVEETVTYNSNKTLATDEWKVYDTDGSTVLATVTDTISYSGVFETSRTRTVT